MTSFHFLLLIPILGCYAKIESLTSADLAKLSNGEWMIELYKFSCKKLFFFKILNLNNFIPVLLYIYFLF